MPTALPDPTLELKPRRAKPDELRVLPTQYRRMVVDLDALRTRAEGDTRLPISISSESPVDRWYGVEVLGHKKDEVDLSRAGDGLPFCLEHDTDDQLGLVEDVTVGKDGVLRGMVRFGNHPDAPWVQKDMESGIRKNISVGYAVNAMTLTDMNDDIDTYRITGWTPMEVSTVAVPADPTVGVGRSSARAEHPVTLDLPARTTTRSANTPQPSPTATQEHHMPEPTMEETRAAAQAAEVARSSAILTLCGEHDVPLARAQEFISTGLTRDQAASLILEERRKKEKEKPVTSVTGVHDRGTDKPFDNLGGFLMEVIRSTRGLSRGRPMDARLVRSADDDLVTRASGMSEGIPADGGFAVPPEFASEILKNVWTTGKVMQRVGRRPMASNRLVINRMKEDSRATGSRYGGIQVYWAGEGATFTPKKPAMRQIELSLGKLIGLWYLTDELVEDAPAMQAEAEDAFRQEITFMAEDSVFNGTGAGQPLGILNSGAFLQIAIEAGQTLANSAQYISKNLAKMYAAMPAALLDDSAWFINQADLLPTIINATMGGTQAQMPVFMPPGMMSSATYGAIFGRPIVPVEYCAAGGTPGDIVFGSLSQYLVGERGGIKTAQSIHVQFLTDELTFRITYRIDGQPVWIKNLTQYKSTQPLSPYIGLALRT